MQRRHLAVLDAGAIRASLVVAMTAAIGLGGAKSRAEGPSDADLALSMDLFEKARRSSDAGACKTAPVGDVAMCREARDLFRRSFKLNPGGLGALKGQAQVEDALGLVASATRHYRELAMKAAAEPSAEKRAWAKPALEAAARLESRVPRLTITMPAGGPKDARVTLDDEVIAEAAWNVPIDVDPGTHTLHVTGTGVAPVSTVITLGERDVKSVIVSLPKLDDPDKRAAPPSIASAPSASSTASSQPSPAPAKPPRSGSSRVAPVVTMSVGVVGVGVGLGLGYFAKSQRDNHCSTTTKICDSADSLATAKGLATGATIATVVGTALVVSGVVWYVLTPGPSRRPERAWLSPTVLPGGVGVAFGGSFR